MTAGRSATDATTSDDARFDHRAGPFEALGQRFEVRCSEAPLAELLRTLYAAMAVDDDGSGGGRGEGSAGAVYRVLAPTDTRAGTVRRDDETIGSSMRRSQVFGFLQWAINRQVIGAVQTERLVLHAAAAELDGVTVVLPAESESGKSTLVAGLVDRGLGYLTDEAVAIAPDLTVEGYLKPMSIDPGSFEVLAAHRPRLPAAVAGYLDAQWQVLAPAHTPAVARSRLGLLVFPTYRAGAPTVIERLGPADTVSLAATCTFGPERRPLTLEQIRGLAAVAASVPAHRLVSGDLDEACAAVIGRLRDPAAGVGAGG